jgi:sulfur oxygenase/reductase
MNQWLRKSAAGKSGGFAVDSGQSVAVMATHRVRPGGEEAFEAGEVATLDMLKESTGMVGYQILKRIGISTLGSGHATVESLSQKLKAIPGSKLERTADVWEGYPLPAEYLVVVEWESLGDARGGMPHVNVKPELLLIHGPKVLDNCLQLPAVRMADSMFREQTYREILYQSQR